MISDRLAHLQAKLDSTTNIPEATRADLSELITSLQAEIDALPVAPGATSGEKNFPDTVQGSVDELTASVGEFEASHPQLTGLAQRIAQILSNMGI